MHLRRRELLALVGFALAGCSSQQTPDAGRQTPDATETSGSVPLAPSETTSAGLPTETDVTASEASTTDPLPRTIEVIERDGWGAAEAKEGMGEHTIERLTIHHSAVELPDNREAPARLLAHQNFHQTDRGWPDLAYHFAIDREGNVYEGRSLQFRGNTATSYDTTGHFLVVLEGNFDTEVPARKQLGSLVDLLAWAVGRYEAGVETIKSHRDYAPEETSCPGQALYDLLLSGELVEAVSASLPEAIELTYLRGALAQQRIADIEAAG